MAEPPPPENQVAEPLPGSSDNPEPQGGTAPGRLITVVWLICTKVMRQFGLHNCSHMAAAISYYALFAVVPLTMVLISLFALLLGSEDAERRISERISEALESGVLNVDIQLDPDQLEDLEERYGAQAVAEIELELRQLNEDPDRESEARELALALDDGEVVTVAGYQLSDEDVVFQLDNLVAETVREVMRNGETLGLISLVPFVLGSLALFGSINRALNVVWGLYRPRPLLSRKLVDLAMLLGMGLLLIAAVVITGIYNAVREADLLGPLSGDPGPLWSAVGSILPALLMFVTLLITYRYVPNRSSRFSELWLGALVAAIGIEILKWGYGVYLSNFDQYGALYGALGGVLTFLVLIYLGSTLLLVGAEISAAYPDALAESRRPEHNISLRQRVRAAVAELRHGGGS